MSDELDKYEDTLSSMRHAYFKPQKEKRFSLKKETDHEEDYSGVFLSAKDSIKVLQAYVSSVIIQIIEDDPEIEDEELESYRELMYLPIIYLADANNLFVRKFDYRASDLIDIDELEDNIG